MRDSARTPQCLCKTWRAGDADNGFRWHQAQIPSSDEIIAEQEQYYLHMIDSFGPERCMFESNFPVDRLSVSYHVLYNAFKKMTLRFSEDESMPCSSAQRKKSIHWQINKRHALHHIDL